MKTALSVAVLCVVVVLVSSENCHRTSDCKATQCSGGSHLGCSNHVCSCFVNNDNCPKQCSTKNDCNGCTCENQRAEHCIDQVCKCFHGHGSPVGK